MFLLEIFHFVRNDSQRFMFMGRGRLETNYQVSATPASFFRINVNIRWSKTIMQKD